ncbi:hypothetical protein DPMN_052486 [Dreissena polymorpha]|nr:hypothetical protein DPMN_052486 [Dreissena polymorpha]
MRTSVCTCLTGPPSTPVWTTQWGRSAGWTTELRSSTSQVSSKLQAATGLLCMTVTELGPRVTSSSTCVVVSYRRGTPQGVTQGPQYAIKKDFQQRTWVAMSKSPHTTLPLTPHR